MEKVIRIDGMTGKVDTVATGLTTDGAKALVRKLASEDAFGIYTRVVPKD